MSAERLSPSALALSPKEEQLKLRAQALFGFIMEIARKKDSGEFEVGIDREELLLWLDSFRSRHFMRLIESAPEKVVPYAMKAQFAGWVTTADKTWPAVRAYILTSKGLDLIILGVWNLAQSAERAMRALGVKVALNADFHVIEPEDLPDGP